MFQTGTIADIKKDVIDALQGRTDVSDSDIAYYAAKSLKELTESNPFSQLDVTGPLATLTPGLETYPVSMFVNPGDVYSTAVSFAIYIDPPTNMVVNGMKYKTVPGIETIVAPAVTGIPAWFTRFEDNFILGPVPNQAFTTFLRYQAKHPTGKTPSLNDPIYLPTSWYDILGYSTAMRIAIVKRWNDQRQYLHDLLFGDPEFVNSLGKRGRPGLISARTFQQERDQQFNSRNIGITVGRMNPR